MKTMFPPPKNRVSESALRQNIESFRARSERVLRQINEQKDEVRQMIAEQLR